MEILNDGYSDRQTGGTYGALGGTAITISSRDFALDATTPVTILSKPGGSTAAIATLTTVTPIDAAGSYVQGPEHGRGEGHDERRDAQVAVEPNLIP